MNSSVSFFLLCLLSFGSTPVWADEYQFQLKKKETSSPSHPSISPPAEAPQKPPTAVHAPISSAQAEYQPQYTLDRWTYRLFKKIPPPQSIAILPQIYLWDMQQTSILTSVDFPVNDWIKVSPLAGLRFFGGLRILVGAEAQIRPTAYPLPGYEIWCLAGAGNILPGVLHVGIRFLLETQRSFHWVLSARTSLVNFPLSHFEAGISFPL